MHCAAAAVGLEHDLVHRVFQFVHIFRCALRRPIHQTGDAQPAIVGQRMPKSVQKIRVVRESLRRGVEVHLHAGHDPGRRMPGLEAPDDAVHDLLRPLQAPGAVDEPERRGVGAGIEPAAGAQADASVAIRADLALQEVDGLGCRDFRPSADAGPKPVGVVVRGADDRLRKGRGRGQESESRGQDAELHQ